LHGQNARHLQNGGLSVKEREEARMKKSQDRQAHWAKVKEQKSRPQMNRSRLEDKGPKFHTRDSFVKEEPSNSSQSTTNTPRRDSFAKEESSQSKPKTPRLPRLDPNMHPSWAAKLQQQTMMKKAQFQGKKLKFEDADE